MPKILDGIVSYRINSNIVGDAPPRATRLVVARVEILVEIISKFLEVY